MGQGMTSLPLNFECDMFVSTMTIKSRGIKMSFTAIYQKVPEGYLAFVEELPGANTQGQTLDEARENLKEAIKLILETNKQLTEEDIAGKDVIREEIEISV